MNESILKCNDERRRQAVRDQANADDGLNGIDYVEVIDGTKQRELCVHFFGDVPDDLRPANVRIEGGERVRDVKVLRVEPHRSNDPMHEDCLRVTVDRAGDFSCYKLCLYELEADGDTSVQLLKKFDPRYACATFSFKIDCPSPLDCLDENHCPPEAAGDEPEINYLAKDYQSFRQLILDRLALLIPDWRERHAPDIGIALVELLAYTGDYLSYYQDAVATEAYLDTARRRISVRRHARLVDYFMHEGCNARAWVCVETDEERETLKAKDFYFITGDAKLDAYGAHVVSRRLLLGELNVPRGNYEIFEPLVEDENREIEFYQAHNEIKFYDWGNAECCLPSGATGATLLDEWAEDQQQHQQHQKDLLDKDDDGDDDDDDEKLSRRRRKLHLRKGDVLIFEEKIGAKTGAEADADPNRRCAVRLTGVEPRFDPLLKKPIVEIEWEAADALPFALCISSRLRSPDCRLIENVSVARGNVILVDHGETVWEKIEKAVPAAETPGECLCEDGAAVEFTSVPGRFRCALKNAPLTFGEKLRRDAPASASLTQNPRAALPQATLAADYETIKTVWHPKFDLLASDAEERAFVVEIDNEGRAQIRFGDGECGRMPEAKTVFTARYRIGNGKSGNVGAETIKYLVTRLAGSGSTMRPRNPLPARGGIEAEPMAEVKLFAPGAFRKKLERAITADDYARLVEESNAPVQRAAADLRWTGSWHEARVHVDPFGAQALSDELRRASRDSLYRYRRIGHDLSVTAARYVPLDVQLDVCVAANYLRGHVEAALRAAFGKGVLPDGRGGFFHPDNLTFGGGVYLSQIIAAAQKVEGVTGARVTKLQRLFEDANDEIANGVLPLGKNEIARLDNDPNFPERGRLTLKLTGGR